MAIREFPRLDLHREIEAPNGRFYRWAKDDPRPENVPTDGSFSTTLPGGFDSDNVSLPRKPGVDYADLERLSTVRAIGLGGEVACETRLKEAPRVSGGQMSIGPASEGWIAHLQDDTTAAEIYRDVDLNGWGETSRDRAVNRKATQSIPGTTSTLADAQTGIPAVVIAWERAVNNGFGEALYDGQGIAIGSVYYDYASQGIGASDWTVVFELHDDDSWASAFNATADLDAGPDTGTFSATSSTRTVVVFAAAYTGGGGPFDSPATAYLRHLAIEGSHGLTIRGTQPEAGHYASDVIANFLSRWAPLINFSTGSTGTLRPSSNVIPHLVFKDKTTALAMLEATNAFEGKPYAVWEDRTFHYFDWGDVGRKWRARVGPTELSETGPSTGRLRNGVIVEYHDVDGSTKSAGPIGSGCDVEDASLEDRDPENPASQLGIKMYGPPIPLGIVSVESLVIQVGALILKRLKETDRSGQMKIVGVCEDDRGIVWPAWQVRAGDLITPIDAAEPVERRIIKTDYDEASFTNTITLDAPPDGVPELLAQLGVGIADLNI
jgi:hypothetical protein